MEIKNIDSLTPELFTNLLKENWQQSREHDDDNVNGRTQSVMPSVGALSFQRVEEGVLSQVFRVHLKYETATLSNSDSIPPEHWLVKLCRSDLNLSWMCRNESNFYRRIAPQLWNGSDSRKHSLPFQVPPFLCGDDHHIILQEVLNAETFQLTNGCPVDKIPVLLHCLAALHAKCWNSSEIRQNAIEHLVSPPGMGQRLHPLQKEGLFASSWKDTVDHVQFHPQHDAEILQFITELSQRLASLKLRAVHDLVHQHRVTLVHGDFHIANWLFPKPGSDHVAMKNEERKPLLLDWATAGCGNPLLDLVFFLIVSTNDEVASQSQQYLEEYFGLLITCNPDVANMVSLKTLKEWFPFVLICQWTILVAYDRLCRQIANAETDEQRRETQLLHFRNVNRRAILALKGIGNWDETLSILEVATEEDQNQAGEFCHDAPLDI